MRAPPLVLCASLLALATCARSRTGPPLGDGGASVDALYSYPVYDLGCAGSSAKAHLVPVSLVMLLDRSGSMGDGVNGDPNLKWIPITQGIEALCADPASAGLSASLQFFALPMWETGWQDQCNPSGYYSAAVPMQSLPSGMTFKTAIDMTLPSGSTPTGPAVAGAISLAQSIQRTDPTQKVAIVLATDGEPDVCDMSVNNLATQVAQVASTIPTYVLGIGLTTQDKAYLDQIAASGGTGSAVAVSVGDPAQTKSDILSALAQIRGLQLSCSFAVPTPPSGQTIDFRQVNVIYTPGGGTAAELAYNSSCTTGVGWRYDNPSAPTQVVLCPSSCSSARSDQNAEIEIIFGCSTVGDLIK
jgi:hypothetical protein